MQHTTRNIALLLVLLSSCSVLKNKNLMKTDSLSRREAIAIEHTSAVSSSYQQHVLLLTDSSATGFLTEIIPEGEFHLSREGGFTGKASLVRIRGSSKSYSALKDSGSISSKSFLNKETESKEKSTARGSSTLKAKEFKSNRLSLLWYWIAFVILAGAGIVYFRRSCL
ncbi:hypothetical protein EKH83_17930 [Arcticibacter tournemirensis]|nr:hypothetical protein [Arcticibacter tournemirensis]RXF67709.1 hypothetical protein EKH83_17930 [Arcticibacter tournemirensis]